MPRPCSSHNPVNGDRNHLQRSTKHLQHQPHLERYATESPIASDSDSESLAHSSIALLGNPNLGARSNGYVRIAVMQRMQSTYGNRATRHFVQRASYSRTSPLPVQRGLPGLDWLEGYISNQDKQALFEALTPEAEQTSSAAGGEGTTNQSGGYIHETNPSLAQQVKEEAKGYVTETPSFEEEEDEEEEDEESQQIEKLILASTSTPGTPGTGWAGLYPTGANTNVPRLGEAPVAEGAGLTPALGIPMASTGLAPLKDVTGPKYRKYRLVKEMNPSHRGEDLLSLLAKELYDQKVRALSLKEEKLKKGEITEEEYRKSKQELEEWLKVNKIDLHEMFQYRVQYLKSEQEREQYELTVDNGMIMQGRPPKVYDTGNLQSFFHGSGWAIFVMSEDGRIYSAPQLIGRFQHSSFFAGGKLASAGELQVRDGRLVAISNKSGHYRPNLEKNPKIAFERPDWLFLVQVLQEFRARGVKLEGVQTIVYGLDPNRPDIPQEYPGDAAKFLEDKESALSGIVVPESKTPPYEGKEEEEEEEEEEGASGERTTNQSGGYIHETNQPSTGQAMSPELRLLGSLMGRPEASGAGERGLPGLDWLEGYISNQDKQALFEALTPEAEQTSSAAGGEGTTNQSGGYIHETNPSLAQQVKEEAKGYVTETPSFEEEEDEEEEDEEVGS